MPTGQNKAQAANQSDILLESGTNELEVLLFTLGNQTYGVNVAKVREVILPVTANAAPNQPESVKGMFDLRGQVLPLVDLHLYFNIEFENSDPKSHRIIVMEFNGTMAAFQVEMVNRIRRMSWGAIKPVPDDTGEDNFAITGIAEIDDQLILMLDFESVYDQIAMQGQYHHDKIENDLGVNRGEVTIYLAEDSKFIRQTMLRLFTNSGYTQVKEFTNGLDIWNQLVKDSKTGSLPDIVITDIEMPQMDGLHLTKQIKEQDALKLIPVIVFSSLITEETRHKANSVGADDQIAKPQLPEMVRLLDKWALAKDELSQAA